MEGCALTTAYDRVFDAQAVGRVEPSSLTRLCTAPVRHSVNQASSVPSSALTRDGRKSRLCPCEYGIEIPFRSWNYRDLAGVERCPRLARDEAV